MKKILTTIFFFTLISAGSIVFASDNDTPEKLFKGRFYNEEHKIYIDINLYDHNVIIPMQEVLGELDGYIASDQCGTTWCIVSSETKGNKATIDVINNYGSEDFRASMQIIGDSILNYSHKGGSTLKFPVNRKWQKIPSQVTFKRKK